MTLITLSKKPTSNPTLEFYSDERGEKRCVTLENFPFRIGRAETADLRVEAVEVSREHAEIVPRNGAWLVRDLGSTNGTQVNGNTITEALLTDGDILKIAETEFTFVASPANQFQRMVTQPIASKRSPAPSSPLPEQIATTRRVIEATLWQATPVRLQTISSLRHASHEALFAASLSSDTRQSTSNGCALVSERYREVWRLKLAESALRYPAMRRLFVTINSAEIESSARLLANLEQLQDLLPPDWDLGISISLSVDADFLRIGELYGSSRDCGLLVAFHDFQGNGGQVMHLKSLRPDYLILASNMTKDLTTTRQAQRRLESLIAACKDLAIQPVLPVLENECVVSQCQEIGFDLMLQPARRSTVQRADGTITV